MSPEHRQSIRRKVRNGARVVRPDGTALGSCLMIDLSATGAHLRVQSPEALPDQFILLLSHDGRLRRECAVAWRSTTSVGVRFLSEGSIKHD